MTTPVAIEYKDAGDGSAVDGAAILKRIRQCDFRVTLDDRGKPRIEPLNRLSPAQRELLREHKDSIRKALLAEKPQECLLTPFDQPSWEKLSEWWLGWTPPDAPYDLESGVRVSDPKQSYECHAELLRIGCLGQTQLALYAWIRKHYRKFTAERSE